MLFVERREFHDGVRSVEVPIDMRRSRREHRTNAVEAMPERVFVERTGRFYIKDHTEQIVDGVSIFLPT